MMNLSGGVFISTDSRVDKQAAVNMAEAGLDYAWWQIKWQKQILPYSANVNLTAGGFTVKAVDDSAREPNTILVTSTGTCKSHSHTIKRVYGVPNALPFSFVWCQQSDIRTDVRMSCSGGYSGLRCNGDIELTDRFTDVSNGAWASGSIRTGGSISPSYEAWKQVVFPDIDFAYYTKHARAVLSGPTAISNMSYPGGKGIIVVVGDLKITGVYDGVYTVVASGNVTIDNSLTPANSSSHLAVLTTCSMEIDTNRTVQAVVYCHNSSDKAVLTMSRKPNIIGSMCTDSIVFSQNCNWFTLADDTSIDLVTMTALQLPGIY
jgi:hypothetical protein